MSDPQSKRWLADDPTFVASLEDLDRGLADQGVGDEAGDEFPVAAAPAAPPPLPTAPPPVAAAPRPAAVPPRSVARPIDAARALDPAHVLDTTPFARPQRAPAPPPAPSPLAFARPSPAEPRARRPLLDLFPASSLEPAPPGMPPFGTAVGPQLPLSPLHAPARLEPGAPPRLDASSYETFYGLRENPFTLSTDPRFHYQSVAHERAGHEILAAIRKRGGPAVLTGPSGIGKTTLCRALAEELDRRTVTSLVLDTPQSLDDLLKTMLVDFGAMAREELAGAAQVPRESLVQTLNAFLESLVPLQASAVLVLDEAQIVPAPLLGDLAALLGAQAARALQLILVGPPELTALLQHADRRALDASVARRIELGPLAADEISSYVIHRLSIAGANVRIEFDEAAIARLFELSAGSPRIVNLLCDRALTRARAASAGVVDGALVEAAAADLDLEAPAGDGPGWLASVLLAACFALLVLVGAAAALWVSRDAVGRTIQQWEHVPPPPGGPVRRLPLAIAPIPPPEDFR